MTGGGDMHDDWNDEADKRACFVCEALIAGLAVIFVAFLTLSALGQL